MNRLLLSAAFASVFVATTPAEDKKPAEPVTLTIVAKSDKYKFDGGGKTPAEFRKELEALAELQKGKKPGTPPKPPAVDLVLVLTNTSKEDVTIFVGGDANTFAFELTGGEGAIALDGRRAFTADFRLPKAVALAPGKAHEIPVKQLADGFRGAARNVYWTGPGEYALSGKYTLSDKDGGKGRVLKSEPVKIIVTEK